MFPEQFQCGWQAIAEQQEHLQSMSPFVTLFFLPDRSCFLAMFIECFSYAEKKVYGFSSSIQNIIQLQGVIQLILILTYWFANRYLNSKEHVGFKIIRALNVKSELVIFRKENMMTWAGPAITTANKYPFIVYGVRLASFVTCSDCTWQSLNTSNKRGWGGMFWEQLRSLSLQTCILYITITISVLFPNLPQSSKTQVSCHVC